MRKLLDIIKDMEKEDFALLKVIASNVEQIKEELKEMRDSIKAKVDVVARQQNSIRTPLVTSGGGGETSHTF